MIETLADHFTEQARGGPAGGSPALIWQGEAIAYGELNMMVDAIAGDIERLEPPADKPLGIRAKKSPEAIAMILACLKQRLPFVLPSVELAPETLDQLFAQADVSHVLAPRIQASGAGWILASEPTAWRRRRVAAARRRRRHVHADDVGVDRPAEDRPAARRGRSTSSPSGRARRSRSAPAPRCSTTRRSTSTSACSTSGRR